MATENRVLDLTFPAAESLASDQYRIVCLNTDGTVRRPDNQTTDRAIAIGVLQNAPAINEAAVVRVIGISKIVFGETVAIGEPIEGEYVSASDAGKGMDADHALDITLGRCLKGGAQDELGEILLNGMPYQVGAVS